MQKLNLGKTVHGVDEKDAEFVNIKKHERMLSAEKSESQIIESAEEFQDFLRTLLEGRYS